MLYGVDVSSNNGNIHLGQLSTTKDFIVIKSTGDEDNNSYVNPLFKNQWSLAKEVGLERATYHYARPQSQPDAIASALRFCEVIEERLAPGDNIALDLEEGDGDLTDWTWAWLQEVEARLDIIGGIYSNQSFFAEHGISADPRFARYWLWLAAWNQFGPVVVPPWTKVTLWQNGATDQSVPGFNGAPALTDVFFGERSDWQKMGKKKAASQSDAAAEYEKLYWTPMQKLLDQMAFESKFPHADGAFHAVVSNAITMHKIAVDEESPA